MKFLPWLIFVVSAVLLWGVFNMAQSQEPLTPRQVLEEVTERLDAGEMTRQDAIADLDQAILTASNKPRPKLLADLHMQRGKVYFDMGGFGRAGEDFSVVLDAYRPGDRRAEAMLVDVDIESGRYDAAEERIRAILAQRPRDARAWKRFGKLSKLIAERALDVCNSLIEEAIVQDDAESARKLILSIAARDLRDASRVALVRRLRMYFGDDDEERVRDILDMADQASRAYRQARTATARSLQNEVTEESTTLMMDLLAMADHNDHAARLGSLLLNEGGRDAGEDAVLRMLNCYKELEQTDRARDIARPWLGRGKTLTIRTEEFFRAACEALYRGQAWPELAGLAGRMRYRGFDKDTERLANLYQGIAFQNREEFENDAIFALSRFFAGLDHEIFPNSRALGYEAKAKAQRNLNDPGELESLLGIHTFDPKCDGKYNLRISRLMQATPNLGAIPPLHHMSLAMSKMPERTDELFEEWRELGKKEVATSTVNMDRIYERLRESKTWVQSAASTAYRIWSFGERYKEDEEWVGLNASAKRVLLSYPGFLPAIDHRIEAELQLGNISTAIELLLDRIDRTGMDEGARTWIDRIPSARSSNVDILRLMRADPKHTGRFMIAQTMIEDGELQRALSFLTSDPEFDLAPNEKRLVAEALVELKRHKIAKKRIEQLLEETPDSMELRWLQLRNLVADAEADPIEIEASLESLLEFPEVAANELYRIVDDALLENKTDLALSMLERIHHHTHLRSGRFILLEAQAHMLRGEFLEAERDLERADAFEDGGGPELTRVFLHLEAHNWPELARESKRALNSGASHTPLSQAILLLFAEDIDAAREAVDNLDPLDAETLGWTILSYALDDFQGRDPEENPLPEGKLGRDFKRLLRGNNTQRRDPRSALGLVLAAQLRGYRPWVRALVRELEGGAVGPLWPMYYEAHVALWNQRYTDALTTLDAVHALRPTFLPAWDLHEAVLAIQFDSEDHERLQHFRSIRAKTLHGLTKETAETLLVQASEALAADGPQRGLELALELVEAYPRWAPGHAHLAEVYTTLDQTEAAFKSWADACTRAKAAPNLRYVPKMLNAVDSIDPTDESLTLEEIFQILDDVSRHLSEDPLLTLRLAELDIELEPVDAATGVDRAFGRLQRFRSMTDKSLNQLRARSARKWISFVTAIDTDEAEMLLEDELRRRPGELELWLLRGDVLTAQGKLVKAIENCDFLLEMSRDVTALKEKASLIAKRGANFREVMPYLTEISERDQKAGTSLEVTIIRLRALLNQNSPVPDGPINTLRNVWRNRKNSSLDLDFTQVGFLYIKALLRNDKPGNRTKARRVIQNLLDERRTDRYETPFFKSIIGLTVEPATESSEEPIDGSD